MIPVWLTGYPSYHLYGKDLIQGYGFVMLEYTFARLRILKCSWAMLCAFNMNIWIARGMIQEKLTLLSDIPAM